MPSRMRGEIGGPFMGAPVHSSADTAATPTPDLPETHNASVDAGAAAQGACAQIHLPTGRMCTLRHSHEASCEFSPAAEADALLALHKADEGW